MFKLLPKFQALAVFCLILTSIFITSLQAQDTCEVPKYHGQGYTTTIASVTDNGGGSYTIVLRVENDGCSGCKKLNSYSVEADPGTYSDISVQLISGSFTFANINYGPDLGGDPFQGFRINNANGMGNGQAAAFSITYTLTGGLQDQQVLVKASSDNLLQSFTAEEFQWVLDCSNTINIHPYYPPPDGGKIYSSLIGAELTSLHETYLYYGYYYTDDIFQIVDDSVLIEVYAIPGQFNNLLSLLQTSTYGMSVVVANPSEKLISGLFPILNLLLLNELPDLVKYARPAFPGIPGAGIVTSQGDTSLRSYVARNGFNLDGSGVKIGVLSDSYNTQLGNQAADDVLRGDLPGAANPNNTIPVDVLEDFPYGTRSDEGRAMLQIIHDVAPKAELAFRTGFKGAPDFAEGIRELMLAGCDVIVEDLTYIYEPFLDDGIVAQAVEEVVSEGVAYFSSAGNFGTNSYQSNFNPSAPPTGLTGLAHDFSGGSGDIYQSISLTEGNYTIVLQWDDGTSYYSTGTDMDIYLARENGSTLFGFNRDNTGGAAVEVLPFNVSEGDAQTNLMIIKAAGASDVLLKYVIFRGTITVNEYFTGASTITGQANSVNAMAVGAVLYSNTPEYGVNPPTIASFSSRGGTPVDGVVRIKPDFTAPNGVNTTVDLGGVNIDGDEFPNFFGTSAAAPHAAALAALIIQAKSKFYDDDISPTELRGILQSSAIDMGTAGFDFATGYGFLQADAALGTLANPSPVITGIYYDTTLVPGVDPIPISISGQYLTDGSVIYFNGEPLTSGTTNIGDSILTGTIPVFSDLYPEIQVYNPPLPGTNGTDGGLSNPLYFTTRKTIVVTIDDKAKKYGEVLPVFTAAYAVEGPDTTTTLEGEGLDSASIARILAIPLETVANDLSNVGLWEIRASLTDPLNPDATATAADSLDLALLDNYNFHFENGLLTISKLDVIIKPRDTAMVYGDSINGFEFDYIYNNDTINPGNNVLISPVIYDSILNIISTVHTNTLVTTVAKVPATALVNEWGEPLLDSATLVNTSIIISEATANAFATALVNGTFISPEALYDATTLVNTVTRENQSVLVPATALVNGTAQVNTYDGAGNLVSTNALFYATALVNSTAQVNSTTINANSNSEAIAILGDGDILILSGDSIGSINLKSINMITGSDVGEHWIIPGTLLSNNFNLSYGLGKLTINPAPATVTADLKVMFAGDTLPDFTATFSGFVNGETDTVVNSLTFSLSPVYNGSAGTYQITPTATADNYIFTSVSAPLYVNPFGSGTKNIKTSLMCIDQVDPAGNNGYSYIAHFKYTNDNSTNVYIPAGEDNYFTGAGSYDPSDQPELFVTGGGTFDVPFDGVKLTWAVQSFNGQGHKSSSASSASSKSSKCNKSAEAEGPTVALTEETPDILAYPNPVRDLLHINLETVEGTFKSLGIFDTFGRSYPVEPINKDGQSLEVNMSGLSQGLYFVRLNFADKVEVVRIIKQ